MSGLFGRLIAATIAIICVASIFSQSVSAEEKLPFDDISKSYAKNEIVRLYNKNIIAGTSKTSFSPTQSITRAEFVTVLNRLLKIEPVEGPVNAFTDLNKKAWYYGSVQAAVQLGLANGQSETTFAPQKEVTRQEAAVWIARALKQTSASINNKKRYNDSSYIAQWANSSVLIVNQLGLMKGDAAGNFRPNDSMTRQEVAVLIDRVLQNKRWSNALEATPKERIIMGWQYGQTTAQYEQSITESNVNTLSPRWYFVGATGAVTDNTDTSLISWANKNNKKIWVMVGNRSDQEATHALLSSSTARNTAVNQLVALVSKYKIDGLNLDFENVHPKDNADLTTFVTLLAEKLHKAGAVLSIDVSPDLGTDWTEAFDYAALGKQVDYVVMMGYDQHYGGSKYPGPNASLPYIQRAISTLLQVVPSDKVILAMPLYNRDWTINEDGTAQSSIYVNFSEQNQLIHTYALRPVWNKTLGLHVASYYKQGVHHSIWFEDARSLITKYNYVVNHQLAGIAYWHIGGESKDIWTSMKNAEKYFDYLF